MAKLKYKFIPEGDLKGYLLPISVAWIDYADVMELGLTMRQACDLVAADWKGAMAINMFDMTATTTNSDGVMMDASMTCIAASDYGKINDEFGYLEMVHIPYSDELIVEEPHLIQWKKI